MLSEWDIGADVVANGIEAVWALERQPYDNRAHGFENAADGWLWATGII